MKRYVIGIAGFCDNDSLPSNVSITFIPEYSWPLFHYAFGKNDMSQSWWFTPVAEVLPELKAALVRFDEDRSDMVKMLSPEDWRGVSGNRSVLAKLIQDAEQFEDNVICWGVEG